MKTHGTLFLFALLFWLQVCLAQTQQVIFNNVLPPEGMNFRHVTSITQDKLAYMWFATKQGLFRYDGYTMNSYKNNLSNPKLLSNNFLESVCADPSSFIWIG